MVCEKCEWGGLGGVPGTKRGLRAACSAVLIVSFVVFLSAGERKLGTVITPDTWKDGARNTTGSVGRTVFPPGLPLSGVELVHLTAAFQYLKGFYNSRETNFLHGLTVIRPRGMVLN